MNYLVFLNNSLSSTERNFKKIAVDGKDEGTTVVW
tara:strand:+ start:20134 stop:20238 length:105 start_codon:yes stop_codon:yes gene_type:complete